MKKSLIVTLTFLAVIFGHYSGMAQEWVNSEIRIKTSGNYLWQQQVEADTVQGKTAALDVLWKSEEVRTAISNHLPLKQENVEYLIRPRGNRYLVIAYISVAPAADSPEHHLTDNPIKIPSEKIAEQKEAGNDSTIKEIVKSAFPEGNMQAERMTIQENTKFTGEEKNTKDEVPTQSDEIRSPDIHYTSGSALLNELASYRICNDALRFLNEQKMRGKVVFSSRSEAFTSGISGCYILVCDSATGVIKHLLDKGSEGRIDVLNPRSMKVSLNMITEKSQKIYVYEF